jgi:hypothetical protein
MSKIENPKILLGKNIIKTINSQNNLKKKGRTNKLKYM